jgi:murein DD-endopeptidase MepM/ murein hydrolase activator NlpD
VPSKKITIIFVSDGARKTKQLKIPKIFILFLPLFIIAAVILFAWVFSDYQTVKTQIPRLAHLQKENKHQKVQLANLSQKIDHINRKMIKLKKFDSKLRVLVNLETGEDNTQFLGIGGSDPTVLNPDYTVEKAHKKLVRLMHHSLDDLDTEISVQMQNKAELYKFLQEQKSMLACTPSIWPVKGWVSSDFGYRKSPFTNLKEFHKGLDISSHMKTPIIAPADGVVSSVSTSHNFGRYIHISHGYGLKTVYGHLAKSLVKKGQSVKRGQTIALLGNTGRTTGPHLHYEVHLNGVQINPLRYILN